MSNHAGSSNRLSRRQFCAWGAGAVVTAAVPTSRSVSAATNAGRTNPFQLNYIASAAMYGTAPLAEVLDEIKQTGTHTVDVWPLPHGNHREQMDELGLDKAQELFRDKGARLGCVTRYDLRPGTFGDEIAMLRSFGGKLIVTGAGSHEGATVKQKVRRFVETMKPDVDAAGEQGITIGIENHSSSVLDTPDAVRYFAELADAPNFGLAMAPYHLPQDPQEIARLITDLGEKLVFFQAWEHGMGCMQKLPKEQELLQMPGRGTLDFVPILAALQEIGYAGWMEVFMHPTPRGIPIHPTSAEVTAEINRSRQYLERCLAQVAMN